MGEAQVANNQVGDLPEVNSLQADAALSAATACWASQGQQQALHRQAQWLAQPATRALAADADRQPPEHQPYNRLGERIDAVHFAPAWHELMAGLRQRELISLPYSRPEPGSWLSWAAGLYLHGQVDAATLCPSIMTTAAIPVLQQEPALFEQVRAGLYSTEYDGSDQPMSGKRSLMIGMGMTEKQGGSDLRANTTRAEPEGAPGRGNDYRLTGHKWFYSAPTSDAHLVLAQTDDGPSCFFVPRWRPDGTRNAIRLLRLKDKLGNRANASSEVEFHDAWGVLVGEPGRGIPTILQMATFSRLACVIGSTAILRQTLVQAIHYARHRQAFGRTLVAQPLMRQVLADMALESEAATWLMVRLARAFEHDDSPAERVYTRVLMPAAKFWICKRAVEFAGEALEVWGGNGYVETGPMARWFREAPVNSVWEGSGNVICLDILRALGRDPDSVLAWLDAQAALANDSPALRQAIDALRATLLGPEHLLEPSARRIARQLVWIAQASLLRDHAPADVAEAFVATRLHGGGGWVLGDGAPLEAGVAGKLIDRAWPE